MARKYIQMGKTNAENTTAINENFAELYSIYDDVEQLKIDVDTLETNMSTAQQNISALQSNVYTLQSNMTEAQAAISDLEDATVDSGWINLSLNSGWSCPYNTDVVQYRKIGNVVYLRGLLNATQAAGQVIGTLPEGFRPSGHFERFTCPRSQSEYVNIEVGYTGQIKDYTKPSNTGREFISLYGISFVV